jgi:hypothetical protein
VTNNNTSNAASTALGLNVAVGHTPFTVNSAVKVANLNADRLDGFDSTDLQQRVREPCSYGTAITAISSTGEVSCGNVSFSARAVAQIVPNPLPPGSPDPQVSLLSIPNVGELHMECSQATGFPVAAILILQNTTTHEDDWWPISSTTHTQTATPVERMVGPGAGSSLNDVSTGPGREAWETVAIMDKTATYMADVRVAWHIDSTTCTAQALATIQS